MGRGEGKPVPGASWGQVENNLSERRECTCVCEIMIVVLTIIYVSLFS